jgi:hypothetical protein
MYHRGRNALHRIIESLSSSSSLEALNSAIGRCYPMDFGSNEHVSALHRILYTCASRSDNIETFRSRVKVSSATGVKVLCVVISLNASGCLASRKLVQTYGQAL